MPTHRAARRVGRPADQGPVVLLRRQGRVLRQQGQQDQVADQRVPLPALRPGPDVGDDGRRDHRRGRRGPAEHAGHQARGPRRPDRRDRGRRRADRAERRHLVAAAARDRRHGRRRRAGRGPGGRPGPALPRLPDGLARIDGEDLFPDNWIYIHDPNVRVGRIQNFRSWSPWMVPDQSKASVGHGVLLLRRATTCGTWTTTTLVELAKRELEQLGLADPAKVEKGYVTRVPKAYPMYDADYAERVDVDPRLARGHRQPHPGRPQRPASVQQLRPLDAHRDARGGEHHAGHQARHLGGQRRVRVPRGGRQPTSIRTSARPRPAPCASLSLTLRFPE